MSTGNHDLVNPAKLEHALSNRPECFKKKEGLLALPVFLPKAETAMKGGMVVHTSGVYWKFLDQFSIAATEYNIFGIAGVAEDFNDLMGMVIPFFQSDAFQPSFADIFFEAAFLSVGEVSAFQWDWGAILNQSRS